MTHAEKEQTFRDWMNDHQGILIALAGSFEANHDSRGDLIQEMLTAIWCALPGFRQEAKPSTFIYRIAQNTALSWQRSHARRRHWLDRFKTARTSTESVPTPEDHADQVDLYRSMQTLSPLDRSMLTLQLQGLSYEEIAEVSGITANHVGVRLNRARKQLTHSLTTVPETQGDRQ